MPSAVTFLFSPPPPQYFVLLLCIFLLEVLAGVLAYVYYQQVISYNNNKSSGCFCSALKWFWVQPYMTAPVGCEVWIPSSLFSPNCDHTSEETF